jgi:8-oxo-dGTP diphosphatase
MADQTNRHVTLGAFAVIFDAAGNVLLGHRRDVDVWDLPGGGVDADESPWDAAVREVEEETGLLAEVERLTGVYHKPESTELVLVFHCVVVGGQLRATTEADQHAWTPLDALPANMNPNQVTRVRDAFSAVRGGSPATRVQPGYSSAHPEMWLGV